MHVKAATLKTLYKMHCEVCDLGLIDYESAWNLQDKFAAEIAAGDVRRRYYYWNTRMFIPLGAKATQRIFCGTTSSSRNAA